MRALIPSPFVGPNSWRPFARAVPNTLVVDYGGVSGPDWYEGVAARIVAAVDHTPWVGVLHSGAGGFAPALAMGAKALKGFVFVDAVLPHPGRSATAMAPAAHVERLRRITTDGMIAPWDRWFGPDVVAQLIPDDAVRAEFLSDIPRVPAAYLDAAGPDSAAWEALPCAFVQLSQAYDDQAARAEQRGWPVRRADLNHLSIASDPNAVAALMTGVP